MATLDLFVVALVTVFLVWGGLDSDAPIYYGLGGSLLSYLVVTRVAAQREA